MEDGDSMEDEKRIEWTIEQDKIIGEASQDASDYAYDETRELFDKHIADYSFEEILYVLRFVHYNPYRADYVLFNGLNVNFTDDIPKGKC